MLCEPFDAFLHQNNFQMVGFAISLTKHLACNVIFDCVQSLSQYFLSPPCNTADLVQDIWCGFKIPPIERYGPLNSTGYRLTHPYTPNIADKARPVQIPKQP